ncbi:MAG: hypothetical protein ACI9TV_002492 [Sulfurimonas sp.]|jgi:hypothetical protein|uniref:hypothetical protein n=1 Tax=Sulfurimonas sp. TaxID=2022749 RepID=UPI0039E6AE34
MGQAKARKIEIQELKKDGNKISDEIKKFLEMSETGKANDYSNLSDEVFYSMIMLTAGKIGKTKITPRQTENAFINEYCEIHKCSTQDAINKLKIITDLPIEKLKKLFSSNTECAFDKLNIAEPGNPEEYLKV